MKKTIAILLVLCLCIGLCACSKTVETQSKKSDISLKDISWNVNSGILDGERYVLLNYTNNTEYAIIYFKLNFRERLNLTSEEMKAFYADIKELWDYSDKEMTDLRKETISMWSSEEYYVAPGESVGNITVQYYSGGWKVKDINHYNLLEPDIATIKYIKEDSIYTVYYDFLAKEYSCDKKIEPAHYWTEHPIGDLIPKPDSPVVQKETDRETLFSFDAFDMTLGEFNGYVEECKKCGFVVDARSHEGFYAAHNADGYEVYLSYFESWNMLDGSVISPNN